MALFCLIDPKMAQNNKRVFSKATITVRKTPDFMMKSGVFMVAEEGLEPSTSGL